VYGFTTAATTPPAVAPASPAVTPATPAPPAPTWPPRWSHASSSASSPAPATSTPRSVGLAGLAELASPPPLLPSSAAAASCAASPALEVVGTLTHRTPAVRRLARAVVGGLRAAQEPRRAPGGHCGGAYVFADEAGAPVALVKPGDEEPSCAWRGGGGGGGVGVGVGASASGSGAFTCCVRPGEAMLREAAAYLLDHGGFAKVPPTALVRLTRAALGGRAAGAAAVAAATPPLPPPPRPPGGPGPSLLTTALTTDAPPPPRSPLPRPPSPLALPSLTLASLQAFTPHAGDAGEAGAGRFPTRDVHAVAILDVRLLNTDRHAGNILVRVRGGGGGGGGGGRGSGSGGGNGRGGCASAAVYGPAPFGPAAALAAAVQRPDCPASAVAAAAAAAPPPLPPPTCELVPIDHGFSLPEQLGGPAADPFLEWLHWPQAALPLDSVTAAYVAALDPDGDVALLQAELPALRDESLRALQVGTRLLQRCMAAGLTLRDVGAALTRPLVDGRSGSGSSSSELERLCWAARADVDGAVGLGPSGGGGCGAARGPAARVLLGGRMGSDSSDASAPPPLLFHLEATASSGSSPPPGGSGGSGRSGSAGVGGGRTFSAGSPGSPSPLLRDGPSPPSPALGPPPHTPATKPVAYSVAGGGWAGGGGGGGGLVVGGGPAGGLRRPLHHHHPPPHVAGAPPTLSPPSTPPSSAFDEGTAIICDASATPPAPACPLAGLEGGRWAAFLEAFEARLAAILASRRWRVCGGSGAGGPGGGPGESCPI